VSRGPYARVVDAAEPDLAPAEVERTRRAPAPERAASTNGPAGRAAAERLASGVGNAGMGGILARMGDGEGILAGGRVHPDVETAVALARGGGRALDRAVSQTLAPAFGDDLGDVRVHAGDHSAALARAVSARAFTVGSDIFFGGGEYRPGTRDGDRLIAHEVAHVVQQRDMPASGPLTVSQPGDALEREADALAHDVGA
jgi:Domain of unknown function (DUF4157)